MHTNWSKGNDNISIVAICESPSNRELSHGFPSIGKTGQGLYKSLIGNTLKNGWLDELDNKIYRTNIVRCQSDTGLQKRVDTALKNRRVRSAFTTCKSHLLRELTQIVENNAARGQIKFIIAVGGDFPNEIKQVKQILSKLKLVYPNIVFEEQAHPSTRT